MAVEMFRLWKATYREKELYLEGVRIFRTFSAVEKDKMFMIKRPGGAESYLQSRPVPFMQWIKGVWE
jgi:hypothetical protein